MKENKKLEWRRTPASLPLWGWFPWVDVSTHSYCIREVERRRHISNRNMDIMRERRTSGLKTQIKMALVEKSYVLQLGIQVGMSDMTNATLGGMSTASSSFMSGSVPMVDLAELAEATNNWDER